MLFEVLVLRGVFSCTNSQLITRLTAHTNDGQQRRRYTCCISTKLKKI